MGLPDFDYRFSKRKKPASTKPVVCIGHETLEQLQSGQVVELDEAVIVPASDLSVELEKAPSKFFKCNHQQQFAVSAIEAVDDFGSDIRVTKIRQDDDRLPRR